MTLFIACIGITPYLYLYIRSGQNPPINEAAPATFDALLAVIRRAQYPPRTPFDDPTVAHGPDNPGRTLSIFGIQLAEAHCVRLLHVFGGDAVDFQAHYIV